MTSHLSWASCETEREGEAIIEKAAAMKAGSSERERKETKRDLSWCGENFSGIGKLIPESIPKQMNLIRAQLCLP
jgi:hypothetical protein